MKIFLPGKFFLFASLFIYSAKLFAVCDNVTGSGTVTGNQTLCGSYNPSVITNLTYPTGGTGTLQYQWQNSPNGTTWTDIAGATLEGYDPPTIASTTYYHRLERRSGCTPYAGTSNTITKTVNLLPVASITAGGPIIFCTPGSVVLTANAVAGTTYQWKKNNANIAGQTNQTYTATTSGTYTVVKTITATGCTATSNSIVVTAQTPLTTTITENSFGICAGSTVQLEVPSMAGATYQWYEGSNLLPDMTLYYMNTGHNSTYSCSITNLCGTYPSAPYALNNFMFSNVPYGGIDASGSTSICTGQSVSLYEINGFFIGYQWYKDGIQITGATSPVYNASQAGNYVLRLTDWCSWMGSQNIYTNWITVTNNGGTVPTPSISAGGSTFICQGQSVTLTETTGPGWTYQWRNGNTTIAGATNSTYSATATGNYNCVVSNICGSYASNSIAVSIQPSTVTISLSGSTTICSGSSVTFSSSSAGNNGTYQWKKNGSSIAGATLSTYQASTTGSYTCSVTNNCGTFTSNAISITVSGSCGTGLWFDGVNDVSTIANNASYAFGTGNFSAEAWVRLDASQTSTYVVAVSNRIGMYNYPGFCIFFNQGIASFSMAGYYISGGANLRDNICHHIAATRTSAGVATLYVDGVQVATGTFSNVTLTTNMPVTLGHDSYFSSYLKGYIMDVRLWNVARSAAQIQNGRNSQLTGNESGLAGYWKLNEGSGQSINDYSPTNNDGVLGTTSSVQTSDPSFQATCAITSAVNCNLPTGLNTTNITNTTAQLNWGGAAADSFMVRYAVHNTTNFVWKKFSGQPNVTSTTITGLLPATQYDWWVRSLCNGGSSSNYQSVPATFTATSTPVPCVTPYGLNATNIGNTSATISWTTMVTADTFRVRYSVNGTTNYIWKDVNGGGSSTSLTGLSPNTAYQFQVSSKCNGVTSPYSTSYVFTTLNTPVPCITPYNLGANNIQNTSATITWTNLVTADTFRVRYSVNGTTNFIWKDVNGTGGSSATLTNLIPNTAYQFQVSSKCNGIISAYSSPFVFTTLNIPVPCIVPYGLSTTNITNNSAKVNWTNLVSADTFRVRYSINGTTNYMWKDVNGAGGTTNTTLTGLNSSATYQWQVRTICNGVQSAYSQSVIFSTAAMRSADLTTANGFENFVMYPNPAHSKTTAEFTSEKTGNGLVSVSDLTGRILYTESFTIREGLNVLEIDVATLPRGIYIVQFHGENSTNTIVKLAVE